LAKKNERMVERRLKFANFDQKKIKKKNEENVKENIFIQGNPIL